MFRLFIYYFLTAFSHWFFYFFTVLILILLLWNHIFNMEEIIHVFAVQTSLASFFLQLNQWFSIGSNVLSGLRRTFIPLWAERFSHFVYVRQGARSYWKIPSPALNNFFKTWNTLLWSKYMYLTLKCWCDFFNVSGEVGNPKIYFFALHKI